MTEELIAAALTGFPSSLLMHALEPQRKAQALPEDAQIVEAMGVCALVYLDRLTREEARERLCASPDDSAKADAVLAAAKEWRDSRRLYSQQRTSEEAGSRFDAAMEALEVAVAVMEGEEKRFSETRGVDTCPARNHEGD